LTSYDVVNGLALTRVNGNTTPWAGGPGGIGANITGGTEAIQVTIPARLQLQYPITLACGFHCGGYNDGAGLMGLTINNTLTSPYAAAAIQTDGGTGAIQTGFQTSENTWTNLDGFTPSSGKDYVVGVGFGGGAVTIYENGIQQTTSSETLATTLTYASTATFFIGGFPDDNVPSGFLFYWAAVWNRLLAAEEHSVLGTNVWQIFAPAWPFWFGDSPILYGPAYPSGSSLRPRDRRVTGRYITRIYG
jgi:hypothetical protein